MLHPIRTRLQALKARADYKKFLASGNPPWSPGYEQHKAAAITAAINDASFDAMNLPPRHGWRLDERVVEYPWFISRLAAGKARLLDAGSTLNHPYVLSHPKLREKHVFVSTLAPEYWSAWQWGVSYVFEDIRETCFRTDYFDTIACISTMEHVELDNSMLYTNDQTKNEQNAGTYSVFLSELKRILKPGGTLFLSMPFGKHVNHDWFQVFDGPMVDDVIRIFAPSRHVEIIYQYLPDGWATSTRQASKDAEYFDIHKTKTYDPDYAAASRAIVCLELTK